MTENPFENFKPAGLSFDDHGVIYKETGKDKLFIAMVAIGEELEGEDAFGSGLLEIHSIFAPSLNEAKGLAEQLFLVKEGRALLAVESLMDLYLQSQIVDNT